MELDVPGVLRRSFDRIMTRSGGVFMVLLLVIAILFTGVPVTVLDTTWTPHAFLIGVFGIMGGVLSVIVIAAAIRTFLRDDPHNVSWDAFTERLGFVTVHLVLGHLVAVAVIGIGFLLIVPGIYLLVSLIFWYIVVVEEHTDFVDAYRKSWRISRGHRWHILGLLLVVVLVAVVLLAVATFLATLSPGLLLNTGLSSAVTAFVTVWSVAVFTEAYRQVQR